MHLPSWLTPAGNGTKVLINPGQLLPERSCGQYVISRGINTIIVASIRWYIL